MKYNLTAKKRREAFIQAYLQTWNISKACEQVGIKRITYYTWIQRHEDFKKEMLEVQEKFLDELEEKLYRYIDEKKDARTLLEVLKVRGKNRGWGETLDINHDMKVTVEFVDKVVKEEDVHV